MDEQTTATARGSGAPTELARLEEAVKQQRSATFAANEHVNRVVRTLVRCCGALSVLTMLLGLISPLFVPRSGDARSLTLFQASDGSREPDVMDGIGTGPGWLIPVLAVALCAVFVAAAVAAPGRRLLTTAEVLCWCLLVGCLLGVAVLAGGEETAAVPFGLVVIVLGGALGVVTVRLARQLD